MRDNSKTWLPYLVAFFIALDFLLGGMFGWFENVYLAGIWLGILFLFLILKPGWGIIILIFSSVLDFPVVLGLRIYQWTAVLVLTVFLFKFLKDNYGKFKKQAKGFWSFQKKYFSEWKLLIKKDYLFLGILSFLVLGSIIGLANSSQLFYGIKQTLVLLVVLIIALIVRYWIKGNQKKKEIAQRSLIFSSIPVSIFALYQNIAHEFGFSSFEIMPARPNSTFLEPDWLGIYTVLVLILLLVQISRKRITGKSNLLLWVLTLINQIVLIITVARASWIAIIVCWLAYLGWAVAAYFFQKISKEEFLEVGKKALGFFAFGITALIFVQALHLTRFNLEDRFKSIYKGEHIVTIAEKKDPPLKFKINLEEIDYYKNQGFFIVEEKISDVNIDSRFKAYASNWEMVKNHFILGQGQGSVMAERNYTHNANNIFWQWWITAGIIGLAAFLALMLLPLFIALGYLLKKGKNFEGYLIHLTALLGVLGIVTVNMFNSGIFFVPMWIFIGMVFLPLGFKK